MTVTRVVAIGASAGGVEAVSKVVAGLPAAFPAAVLVTLHMAPDTTSVLPQILDRASVLRAARVMDGEALAQGRIYVASPDRHLVVADGEVWNQRGPREHHSRPAVDPMLRSVAEAYGRAAIGVVLTGALDDGTAGLLAIKRAGGLTIAQDPATALHRSMPASAIAHVDVDAVLALADIAPFLVSVVGPPDRPTEGAAVDADDRHAAHPPALHPAPPIGASPSAYSCPDCGGVLWEIDESDFVRYRCRVGHAYTSDTLHRSQGESVEEALWSALRALEERAALSRRMAQQARDRGHLHTAGRFDETADEAERNARLVNGLLVQGPVVDDGDAEAAEG